MHKLIPILLFFLLNSLHVHGHDIDSMVALYPKQPDRERAQTLAELCYQLSFNDTKSAIHYGEMSYRSALASGDTSLVAQTLNDWSIPYLVKGDYDSVLVLCDQALMIRSRLGDSVGVAKLLNKMANANYELGQLDIALRQNMRALRLFEAAGQTAYVGRVLSNIGVIYERNKMFEDALEHYQRARQIAIDTKNENAYYVALASEGNCLAKLGEYQVADQKMNEALAYYRSQGNVDMIAGQYQNLGVNARLHGHTQEGLRYYRQAYALYKKNNNQAGISLIAGNLGNIFMDFDQLDSAEVYLVESFELAKENQSFYQLQSAYKSLMRLENLRGNYPSADRYFELYEEQIDSIYNSETNAAISEMKVKYDTEAKTRQLQNEQLKNENSQLLLTLAAVAIMILFLALVLFIIHKRLQAQKLVNQGLLNLEKERNRIARDLHDHLGAELTLITSKVDIEAYKSTDQTLSRALSSISELSKSANYQLRETIWSVHQSKISYAELINRIQTYGERVNTSGKLTIKLSTEKPDFTLSPATGLHLYRICQEGINNVLKYAHATELHIELKTDELIIRDNGHGFDLTQVNKGYGLNNMKSRTEEIGGTLSIQSGESGTEISLHFNRS